MGSQAIDQMPRPKSAFLSLPQELRDHIYEYLLTTTMILLRKPYIFKEVPPVVRYRPNTHLAILNVSRSTYEEGRRVLYRNGHICFDNFTLSGPHLYDEFDSTPAIKLLQNITLHIGAGAIIRDEVVFGKMAARLIDSFADSSPEAGVPRKRCVVEFVLVHDGIPRPVDTYITTADLTDTLGRLTRFKTVEVAVWYSHLRYRLHSAKELVRPLQDAFDGRLTTKLGEVEKGIDKRCFRWIYHPYKG